MSEAVRDVTVRVSVEGGKIDKMPDFDRLAATATSFYNVVTEGNRQIRGDLAEVTTATAKLAEELQSAASIDLKNLGGDGVNEVSAAIEKLNQEIAVSVDELEAAWSAADELAEAGQQIEDELAASLEAATQQAMDLAQAELDAKYEGVEAAKDLGAATAQAGKSSAEIMFKQIALTERLAAHQRKQTEDVKKQEAEKQAAIKKAGEEQQRQFFAATGALAQALAAGTQFIATIKLIGGESPEIEELAKQFAKVQGVVQGIAAGTQAFNSINQGLTGLQAAAAAASTQLGITGATATATQTALIRLAPAAAMAQAALGPLAVAIAGISLAVTAVSAISNYFAEDLPNEIDESNRALERTTAQLDKMKNQIDRNAQSIAAQNVLLRAELDLRNTIDGVTSGADVEEKLGIETNAATSEANTQLQSLRIAMAREQAELKRKLVEQNEAAIQIFSDTEGQDDPIAQKRREMAVRDIRETEDALNRNAQAQFVAATELQTPLTTENMDEYAKAIKQLPKEQQAVYEKVLADFVQAQSTAVSSANADLASALRENEMTIKDNANRQEQLQKQYEQEQNVALRLQGSPEERLKLEQGVNAATATGNLNAGIDALSGVISSEREQELRNQLAEGNLTRERLLAEIADAAEFETEKKQLEQSVKELQEQAKVLAETREALSVSQAKVRKELEQLHQEIRDTQQAQQAR